MAIFGQTMNLAQTRETVEAEPLRYSNNTYLARTEQEMLSFRARPGDEVHRYDLLDGNGNPSLFKLMRLPASDLTAWQAQGGGGAGVISPADGLPADSVAALRQLADALDAAPADARYSITKAADGSLSVETDIAAGGFLTSKLEITAAAASIELDVNAAGTGYTHSGTSTHDLGATDTEFRSTTPPDVLLNGRSMKVDARLSWLSPTRVRWADPVRIGDVFAVRSIPTA